MNAVRRKPERKIPLGTGMDRLEDRLLLSGDPVSVAPVHITAPLPTGQVVEMGPVAAGEVAESVAATGAVSGARAGLPATGYVSRFEGVQLDGRQCVPAARDIARTKLRRDLPYLGQNGVAAQLWEIRLDGWNKIANDGRKLPPARGSLMIWGRQLNGTGHVAFVLGTVNPRTRTVRVVDANWGLDQRGQIHDVRIDGRVLGWIVPV